MRLQCVILAGGLGTRMRHHDESVPKALLSVAGQPFAYWQLRWLAAQGVDVVYSIGYKGELIRRYVEDGSRWGISVTYVDEQANLLGTGGALRLAHDQGVLEESFFVLYGDAFLRVDMGAVDQAFRQHDRTALMTVYENRDKWDTSNVAFRDGMVTRYRKGKSASDEQMHFIDYGLSEISTTLVGEYIPAGEPFDLAQLFSLLSDQGKLAGFEASERFFEIGSPTGLADFEAFLRAQEDGGAE